jgi:hypothetical protein
MDYTPHGYCLAWDPNLLMITIIGHGLTAAAYVQIPLQLIWLIVVGRGQRLVIRSQAWIYGMFAAFIFLCGVSHIFEIMTLFFPVYWALAIEVCLTGIVSQVTSVMLLRAFAYEGAD